MGSLGVRSPVKLSTRLSVTSAPFLLFALVLLLPSEIHAQRGGRGGRGVPATPHAAAPFDLTGYWVSVITEDWKTRMVTPKKGFYVALPLNAEGRRVADGWDPAKDEAAGEQCRS